MSALRSLPRAGYTDCWSTPLRRALDAFPLSAERNAIRELCGGETGMRDLPGEAAETGQLAGCFPVQSDHAYWLFDLVADDSDRFDEIRVLRENKSLIEQPAPCM